MATTPKKRGDLSSVLGRPCKGDLSSYPAEIIRHIKAIRINHPGWGAQTIQIELVKTTPYGLRELPSISAIHRYLKQEGLVKPTVPRSSVPSVSTSRKIKRVHDLWELDAQGAVKVAGIGYQALINIKDIKSKVHCMAFPVNLASVHSQSKVTPYYWSLRLAFLQWGFPKVIQVDKASVFFESTSKSPFPTLFHLWLVGLGMELKFITKPPPAQNASVERAHQTMEKQAIQGQHYTCWKYFFKYCNERRKRMNEDLPNRSLGKKAPLQVFPNAAHSARPYSLETEQELVDFKRIHRHLAKYTWYRKVGKNKTLSLGGHKYYVKNALPQSYVQIKFCNRAKKLVFRNGKEQILAKCPIKKIDHLALMGNNTKGLKTTFYKINHFKDFIL